MKKNACGLLVIMMFCFSCAQRQNATGVDTDNEKWKIKEFRPIGVETETDNNGIVIQNSFPRGDGYKDSKGKVYPVAIFWTRVINRSKKPIQLSIDFKADSLVNPMMSDLYSRLFLPPDTMTLDKTQVYGYDITDLRYVLDNPVNELTSVQRTIAPDQEYMFRVGMFSDRTSNVQSARDHNYTLRTGLLLKNEDLVYVIRANRKSDTDSTLVPFGKIVVGN